MQAKTVLEIATKHYHEKLLSSHSSTTHGMEAVNEFFLGKRVFNGLRLLARCRLSDASIGMGQVGLPNDLLVIFCNLFLHLEVLSHLAKIPLS